MKNIKKYAVLIAALSLLTVSFIYVSAEKLPQSSHGIGVLKTADSFAYVGDLVTYEIQVYNPSSLDLHNINITDTMLNFTETIPFMAVGNITGAIYTLHREVLDTDPNPLVNTVSVEAIDSEGAYSTASTQAITTIVEHWIDIAKMGPDAASQGETIKYTITVNNTAAHDLADVLVEDELLGFSWQGDLHAGEVNLINLSYTIPCDIEDTLTNTATVWAQLNETTIYAEASWTTEIVPPTYPCYPHSKGYWKNHPDAWPTDELELGGINYTKEEALAILIGANAKDATRMLTAQLIAAKLNRLAGCAPHFNYCNETVNIDEIIDEADTFLETYPLGSDPRGDARQEALHIKDLLDLYNNSGCE